MLSTKSKWLRLGMVMMILAVTISLALLLNTRKALAAAPHNVGLVCTTDASSNPTFTLETQTGYITLSDMNTMFMWGYSMSGGEFQYPGPVLCVNQGQIVTIVLHNNLPEDSSIMFPGQENVLADGSPAQPQFNGTTLTSLTNVAAANGGSITYRFTADHPGTFIYESGTDTRRQVGMGLFGVLIVRPSMGSGYVYNRADSQFTKNEEFLAILSEIDPYMHNAAEAGQPFDMNTYHPRYWLLNGRGFPDTIADNFASWLPSQPYGALALIQPYDASVHPFPALEHFVNVGTEDYPFHPHGQNGLVVGRDGHPMEGSAGQDLSMEKFAINIGPGQTWDVLFKWYDAEGYTANPSNFPVTIPDIANQTMGMFYSGSPFLGQKGALLPGQSTLNQCGEYYIISHNHALFQLDAWGQTMSGPITYLRIDPPGGCP